MSAMSDYALALQEEEEWVGRMNEEAERRFRIRYTKGRLPKQEQQPKTKDNGTREQDR